MRIGLFIGRFQPLHKGHEYVLRRALKSVDRLIIVIGSSQKIITERNCFTAKERKKMVQSVFPECTILLLPDNDDNARWTRALLRKTGHVDALFSSNALVRSLLRKEGIKVYSSKSPYQIHGTLIRKKLATAKPWKHLVPASVVASFTPAMLRRVEKLYKRR
jgi:nicotinamide-nucleotide adenylyltransferase